MNHNRLKLNKAIDLVIINNVCLLCNEKGQLLECDNSCGSFECESCGGEFHIDSENKVYLAHNNNCGNSDNSN